MKRALRAADLDTVNGVMNAWFKPIKESNARTRRDAFEIMLKAAMLFFVPVENNKEIAFPVRVPHRARVVIIY